MTTVEAFMAEQAAFHRRVANAAVVEPYVDPVIPPPVVPARPATAEDMAPLARSAKALGRKAKAAGWKVRATYAQGPWIEHDGTVSGVRASIVLRFHRAPHSNGDVPSSLVAWWVTDTNGKWGFRAAWATKPALQRLSSPELKAVLDSEAVTVQTIEGETT